MEQPLRRSARLALAPSKAINTDVNDHESMTGIDLGVDDDYVDSVAEPPRKKARKSRGGATRKSTNKKKLNSLSMLPELPLDVLFEIFGWLDLESLLNLALVNRSFWETLIKGGAAEHLFLRILDRWEAPDAPKGYSTLQWAVLLLGKPICMECKRESAAMVKLDFLLHRRYCNRCLKDRIFPGHKIKKVFKDVFPVNLPDFFVNLLFPVETCNVPSGVSAHHGPYYLKDDVCEVVLDICTLKPDNFLRFSMERMEAILARLDNLSEMMAWRERLEVLKTQEAAEVRKSRHEEIVQNMVEYGYTEEETRSAMRFCSTANKETKLTKAVWTKLRPEIERRILTQRHANLCLEHNAIFHRRKEMLTQFFDALKQFAIPRIWRTLPLLPQFMDLIPVKRWHTRDVNAADAEEESGWIDLANVVSDVKDAIDRWQDDVRKTVDKIQFPILNWVTYAYPADLDPAPELTAPLSSLPPIPPYFSSRVLLGLGWAVFTCAGHAMGYRKCGVREGVMFGWDELMHHRVICAGHISPRCKGAAAGAVVIQLAGKNVLGTSASDMDKLDLKFVCLACEKRPMEYKMGSSEGWEDPEAGVEATKSVFGVKALSWRECVLHHITTDISLSRCPIGFRLVTEEESNAFAWQQKYDQPSLDWTCAICPEHYENWQTLKTCCQHVKEVHKLGAPEPFVDVILRQGVGYHLPPLRVIEKPRVLAEPEEASTIREVAPFEGAEVELPLPSESGNAN